MGYVTYRGQRVSNVRCKGCNELLRDDGKPTPAYCGLMIAMREPDGQLSKHETTMCKICKTRLVNEGAKPGELEKLYAEDIEAGIEEALRGGHMPSMVYNLAARQAARTPLRVLNEPGSYGE